MRRLSRAEVFALAAVCAAAAALRLMQPFHLVMLYSGYDLIGQTFAGETPKYGAGWTVLFRAVTTLLPPVTETVLRTNAALGSLCVPLAALLASRLFAGVPGVAVAMATLAGLSTLFIKDHGTESNMVATLFFFWAGLHLWLEARDAPTPHRTRALALMATALGCFSFAAVCRPLFLLIAPATLLALSCADGEGLLPRAAPRKAALALVAVFAAVLVPQMLWAAQHLFGGQSEIQMRGPWSLVLLLINPDDNLLLQPKVFPVWVWVGLWPMWRSGQSRLRRTALALVAVAGFAFVLYQIDQPSASYTRLQIPAAMLALLPASAGLSLLAARLRARSRMLTAAGGAIAAALLIGGGFLHASYLLQVDNQRREDRMLRHEFRTLPAAAVVLRLGVGDNPRWGVSYAYPDYDWKRQRPDLTPLTFGQWKSRRHSYTDRPSVLYLGMRCYADLGAPGLSRFSEIHPVCRHALETLHLHPLVVEEAPNRFDYRSQRYPDQPLLTIGYYLIKPDSPPL